MVFVCSICQDVLLKFDSDNEGGAVSGECGHVFHQYCLNEWLRIGAGGKVCPCCRGDTVSRALTLCPIVSSALTNSESCKRNLELRSRIDSLKSLLVQLQVDLDASSDFLKYSRSEYPKSKHANMQLTSANKIWRKRTENCGELEKGFAELKVAKEQLEVLVKRYESVDNITRSLQTNTILETKDTCCTKTCSEMLQENMTLSLEVQTMNNRLSELQQEENILKIMYADVCIATKQANSD